MFPSIWNNDEAIQFFEENNYPRNYNDGLYAYLKDIYAISNTYSIPSLPDLLKRYLNDYGDTFNMSITLAKSAVAVSLVEPVGTFINSTPTDGGSGTTILTSAGVHGLTAAVSVGANIYISAGTGWTVGFHKITAIAVDTTGTTIQIDTPFSGAMGVPTIALANTFVVVQSVTIPPLLPNSQVRWDAIFTAEPDAAAGSEDCVIRYGGSQIQGISLNGTTKLLRWLGGFANKGVTNQQVNYFINGSSGSVGITAVLPNTYTVDSSIPQMLEFSVAPSMPNSVLSLNRFVVELLR